MNKIERQIERDKKIDVILKELMIIKAALGIKEESSERKEGQATKKTSWIGKITQGGNQE